MFENSHLLIPLFFLVAFLYSMVGFGGGSSYIALLILMGVSHTIAPSIALICNIIVVTGGTIHFVKNGELSFRIILPYILFSVPLAFVGGLISIDLFYYQLILGMALLVAASRMLLFKKGQFLLQEHNQGPSFLSAATIGSLLGFISGLVGIGGGIFLAPILYFFKWGNPKAIAATASAFILVNSVAGLFGQMQKMGEVTTITTYSPLLVSVFVGGQLGSWLCTNRISFRRIEVLTSVLILFVSFRLLSNVLS